MKREIGLIALLLLVLLVMTPASATNATKMGFSDLGLTGPQQIEIYQEGILVGTYNTTESNVTLPDKDFLIIIKPELKTHWFDAGTFLTDMFGIFQTNWEALLLIALILGIVIYAGKSL